MLVLNLKGVMKNMKKFKRLKNIVWFIFITFIIVTMYMLIYKNVDKLIPKRENEIFLFPMDSQDEKTEFIYEMYDYIIQFDYYKKPSESELANIKSNSKIKKIFMEGLNTEEKYIDKILESIQIGRINNTVYGDLNVILFGYVNKKGKVVTNYIEYMLVYSDDFNKVFYFNNASLQDAEQSNLNSVVFDAENDEIKDIKTYEEREHINDSFSASKPYDQDTSLIVQNTKQKFSQILEDVSFNPDTVMYKNYLYILKDTEHDITVYYNFSDNVICSFYIGFDKF